jgi:hypothetical protein
MDSFAAFTYSLPFQTDEPTVTASVSNFSSSAVMRSCFMNSVFPLVDDGAVSARLTRFHCIPFQTVHAPDSAAG